MDELERAAKALWAYDRSVVVIGAEPMPPWEDADEDHRAMYRRRARTAISAYLEGAPVVDADRDCVVTLSEGPTGVFGELPIAKGSYVFVPKLKECKEGKK